MPVKKSNMVYGETYLSVRYEIPYAGNFAYLGPYGGSGDPVFSLQERKVGAIKRNPAGKITGFEWERVDGRYDNWRPDIHKKEQVFSLQERDAAEAFLKSKQAAYESEKQDFLRTKDLIVPARHFLERLVFQSPVWSFVVKCGIQIRSRSTAVSPWENVTSQGCTVESPYGRIYCAVALKMELEDEVYFRLVANRPELTLYCNTEVHVFDEIPEWLRIMGEGRLSDWKTTTPAGEFYRKLTALNG